MSSCVSDDDDDDDGGSSNVYGGVSRYTVMVM